MVKQLTSEVKEGSRYSSHSLECVGDGYFNFDKTLLTQARQDMTDIAVIHDPIFFFLFIHEGFSGCTQAQH